MFELTFLGTAASTPSAERGLPAVLVQAGGERFLIDCGEGTQRQLLRAGSGFRRLGHVLLTHAHLDHVLGLGGLIATLGLMDIRTPLRICGSGETMRFVAQYLASLYPLPRAPVPLDFIELQAGRVLAANGFTLRCFPVKHRGTESLGFRFETVPRARARRPSTKSLIRAIAARAPSNSRGPSATATPAIASASTNRQQVTKSAADRSLRRLRSNRLEGRSRLR